jgi:hypothetical protein
MTTFERPTTRQALCPSMRLWTYSFIGLSVAGIAAVIAGVAPLLVAGIYVLALGIVGSGCAVMRRRG